MTPLDTAHAAMEAAPDDDDARLTFYDRVAAAELYLLLTAEPEGDALDPRLFETSQGTFVLVFDRVERLGDFAHDGATYAALSGRTLTAMLTGQGVGLALNPGVAPSSFLMPPDAVDWLAGTLRDGPDEIDARPTEIAAPTGLPEKLLGALDAKLATATGLARMAYLVATTYEGGGRGHMLAFIDPARGANGALARAVREALVFSGLEAGTLDVAFFDASDPMAARLARHGLRFDLPKFEPRAAPSAPGTDPDRPPKLR
ncbi:SseB protein N-terminal domain-containing protein [Palleronia salina]|uniref:SseB protein N-terminal domain-containing protein n=1 Tax=Palleronia salina TaxID=313368 RepID=A0A1M6GCX6_9RHOB|nr:SseB family protein [Palleronia salina]SHJ07769.1 SseB protein N-terminal domain-containing protein [Palleronia salina]